jgi:hypothetical protein
VVEVASSALTHYFFDRIEDKEERARVLAETRAALEAIDPITVHAREALPPAWNYAHPYRTGDLVAVLPGEYAFYRHEGASAVQVAEVTGRYFGAHGYDPRTEPSMRTVFFAQRYPEPLRRGDLGPMETSRIHATVADLLEIEPSPQARPDGVDLWRR